ncbi:hypothetical protein AN2V17_00710 [Vallitalea sp. AN17-2]|uniref:Uncharacterized protein n=1 Tax=Vallitalea maricola TaxID=3074433 RepID=A0ACB5UE12_9FIRM|nr:hypothetical protein AN2V17_00710 [Vallitalea sp. AN17-2]
MDILLPISLFINTISKILYYIKILFIFIYFILFNCQIFYIINIIDINTFFTILMLVKYNVIVIKLIVLLYLHINI